MCVEVLGCGCSSDARSHQSFFRGVVSTAAGKKHKTFVIQPFVLFSPEHSVFSLMSKSDHDGALEPAPSFWDPGH